MSDTPVCRLTDLARLRSAPELESSVIVALHRELTTAMAMFSWFTVGVMASSASEALEALRSLERDQNWDALDVVQSPSEAGPVYLKANQQGGTIRIRIEHGLGCGILISGHADDSSMPSNTWGPLPLNFFQHG